MEKKYPRKTSSLHIDNDLHAEFKIYCAVKQEKIQRVTEKLIKNEIDSFDIFSSKFKNHN
jgi:hypothetical protein